MNNQNVTSLKYLAIINFGFTDNYISRNIITGVLFRFSTSKIF